MQGELLITISISEIIQKVLMLHKLHFYPTRVEFGKISITFFDICFKITILSLILIVVYPLIQCYIILLLYYAPLLKILCSSPICAQLCFLQNTISTFPIYSSIL